MRWFFLSFYENASRLIGKGLCKHCYWLLDKAKATVSAVIGCTTRQIFLRLKSFRRQQLIVLQDILKLRMLDRGTAEALWRLGGTVGVIPISIAVTSTFKLDLITGNSSIAFSPIVKLVYAYVASAPLSKTMIGNLGNLGQVLTAICLPLMNICAIRSKVNRSSIGSCFMDVVAFACIFYPAMAQDILFPPMRPPKGWENIGTGLLCAMT